MIPAVARLPLYTFTCLAALTLSAGPLATDFPPGTVPFFGIDVVDAEPANDGIWAATAAGLVNYTRTGIRDVVKVPGDAVPREIELAPDGSMWVATAAFLARLSTTGAILEQYPVDVSPIVVAPDGRLWYFRVVSGQRFVGHIAGGVRTEFPAPPASSRSLATALNGDVWIPNSGAPAASDTLYRMTPAGTVTALALNRDIRSASLQSLPDGTLLIYAPQVKRTLRLSPGAQAVDGVSFPARFVVPDSDGNLWAGDDFGTMEYFGRSGLPRIRIPVPTEPIICLHVFLGNYRPLAVDSEGGVWYRITEMGIAFIREPPPCREPPPPFPRLIRIDAAQALAIHGFPHDAPTLSPVMLIALGLALALLTMWRIRGA